MDDKTREIAADLKSYLQYLKEMGIEALPVSEKSAATPSPARPSPRFAAGPGLEQVRSELGDCRRCRLRRTRKTLVFGEGNRKARLMIIGEGPGSDEDVQGKPFVGRAGQLLTKIIQSINLSREEVYITNIVKCRPPQNRNPEPDEIASCNPFLEKQIDAIRPEIILALGKFAAQTLLRTDTPITALRGKVYDRHGIKVIPTYHPAYLLRNPEKKREVWEDMKRISEMLKTNNKD